MAGGKDGIGQLQLSGSPDSLSVGVEVFVAITDGSGHLPFGARSPQCRLTMSSADANGFSGTTVCRHINPFAGQPGGDPLLYDVTATFSWTP